MSETRDKSGSRFDLDGALRGWPDVERSEEDWEKRAEQLVAHVRGGHVGATSAYVMDEDLLAHPLGQSSEDGHNSAVAGGSGVTHPQRNEKIREGNPMTMPADRERDRRSLQDLAKMAQGLTPPPSSVAPSGVHRALIAPESSRDTKDDSGIVDLAAASQADPQAAARAQSTALASQGLFDEEPPAQQASANAAFAGPPSHPHGALAQPAPSLPPMPASVPPASFPAYAVAPSAPAVGLAPAPVAGLPLPVPAKKKSGGAGIALLLGGVVALSAAAAGGFLYLKSKKNVDAVASAPVATAPAQPVAAAVATTTPAPAAEPAPTPAAEPSTDPNALPGANAHGKVALARTAGVKAAPAAKPAHEAAPAKAEGPAKMTEKDLAAAPAGPGGDLGAAMKKEVGEEAPKTPAAATMGGSAQTGNVPQKPSQGAVTGAIGAVLPQARACLGPDDPVSRASILFASSGTVQSVNVSGSAAGKPAEACIKGALMKAKVQPFAEPTYTANITVRHN